MKRHYLTGIRALLLGAIISLPTITAYAQDFGKLSRYEADNKVLSMPPQKGEKRVVFLGNSITEGWWNHHKDFFQHPGYIARGISGQTSYQFLYRFREDVVNLRPALVIINAGTNDIAENTCPYDEDRTFGNIQSMVEIAKANKIKVILTSVLPAARFGWSKVTDGPVKIKALNARIQAYAKKNKIPYVNYFDSLVASDGVSLKAEYTKDGVHPLLPGYQIMESLIVPVIEKTL